VEGRIPNLSAGVIGERCVGRDCAGRAFAGRRWRPGLHGAAAARGEVGGGG
jgi:hypothetical protein